MSDAFAQGTCVKATLYDGKKEGAVVGHGLYQHATRHGHCLKVVDGKGQWTAMEVPSACVLCQVAGIVGERAFAEQYVLKHADDVQFLSAIRRLLPSIHGSQKIKRAISARLKHASVVSLDSLQFLFGCVDDADLLKRVIRKCKGEESICAHVGMAALKALSTQDDFLEVVHLKEINSRILVAAVDRVASHEELHRLAERHREALVRKRAVQKLTRLGWLDEIADNDRSPAVRTAAFKRAKVLRKVRDQKKAKAN